MTGARVLVVALASQGVAWSNPWQDIRPHRTLDHIQGANLTFATFPVTPMVVAPETETRPSRLWTVNHHEHLLEAFVDPLDLNYSGGNYPQDETPLISVNVAMSPVSVAYWSGGKSGNDEILVTCKGTWSVLRFDADNGMMIGAVQLRASEALGKDSNVPIAQGGMAEPSDIVVDELTDTAYVSCPGVDAVIRIDLVSGTITDRYDQQSESAMRLKTPLFLAAAGSLGENGSGILVAPLTSGNKTTTTVPNLLANVRIVTGDLPDEDLFLINPSAPSGSRVTVASTSRGTTLFDHGINPVTGHHWQLMTDALNVGADNDTEPELNGRFVSSRLTFEDLGGSPGSAPPTFYFDDVLDVTNTQGPGGSGPAAATSQAPDGGFLGQPYGLAFDDDGNGYVIGLLTNNVICINASGKFLAEWKLPAGAHIPRGILATGGAGKSKRVAVYCWGSNEILYFGRPDTSGPLLLARLSLTQDTTPVALQDGRRIFFDGAHSRNGAMSCASCHIDGATDLLGWNLSNFPIEQKGAMMTQTLVGIDRKAPFHWRGERDFGHFNGAFGSLLGRPPIQTHGEGLAPKDFDVLRSYVFSLQSPANPNANILRVLDNRSKNDQLARVEGSSPSGSGTAYADDAFQGDDIFFGDPTGGHVPSNQLGVFGEFTCADCHQAPTGNIGEAINVVRPNIEPVGQNTKTAPLLELWRKDMSTVPAGGGSNPDRAFLGFGVAHPGSFENLASFVSAVVAVNGTEARRRSVLNFVNQWDQGIGPAAHYVASQAPGTSVWDALGHARFLLPQAKPSGTSANGSTTVGNCDVVVIEYEDVAGVTVCRKWMLDRSKLPTVPVTQDPDWIAMVLAAAFVSDDSNVINRSFYSFATDTAVAKLFIGLPPGLGEKFALDRDMDGKFDVNDPAPRDPGTGGATAAAPITFVSGPEIDWSNADKFRVLFSTDQPADYVVTVTNTLTQESEMVTSSGPSLDHSVIVPELEGSTGFPSMANLGLDNYQRLRNYQVEVKVVSALAQGGSDSVTLGNPTPVSTSGFIEPTDAQPQFYREDVGTRYSFFIDDSSLERDALNDSTDWLGFKAEVDLDFVRERNMSDQPEARFVVARLLTQASTPVPATPGEFVNDGPASAVLASDIAEGPFGSVALVYDAVYANLTPLPKPPGAFGSQNYGFLFSRELSNGANGKMALRFRVRRAVVDAMAVGDSMVLSIDAVTRPSDGMTLSDLLTNYGNKLPGPNPAGSVFGYFGSQPATASSDFVAFATFTSQWNMPYGGEAAAAPRWRK